MTTATDTTTEAWLAWRAEGVGASDVAGILGISPYTSSWRIWAEKVGLLPPEEPGEVAEQLEAGHFMELAVGPWFGHRTGMHVAGEQLMLEHPEWPVARCTLDGLVFDGPLEVADTRTALTLALGGLEIKHEAFGKRWEHIPAHYQCQGFWQMYVAGLERVWFAVLQGRSLRIHELVRDEAEIAWIVGQVETWWHDHVVGETPPPVDGSDATREALAAVYPESDPELVVDLGDDDRALLVEFVDAKAVKKAAVDRADELGNALRARLGAAEVGLIDGKRAVTWKTQESRRLDTDGIRANHPRITKRFERVTQSRVLRTPYEKELGA
jgi:putative phage-type endonuclease